MVSKKVYIVDYWLKNSDGVVVDTSEGGEPMVFIEDGKNVVPGMLKAVEGRNEGDKLEVVIPPELAYGRHDSALISQVPLSVFEGVDQVVKGMKFQTNGGDDAQVVQVVDVTKDQVSIDANHPLAGIALNFEIEIIKIRSATPSEIESGIAIRD